MHLAISIHQSRQSENCSWNTQVSTANRKDHTSQHIFIRNFSSLFISHTLLFSPDKGWGEGWTVWFLCISSNMSYCISFSLWEIYNNKKKNTHTAVYNSNVSLNEACFQCVAISLIFYMFFFLSLIRTCISFFFFHKYCFFCSCRDVECSCYEMALSTVQE